MRRIDLNADIGEGFGYDLDLMDWITSANICCGEHAGSWSLAQSTAYSCRQKGIRIGAHPGYPDRETMGRGTGDSRHAKNLFGQLHRFTVAIRTGYIKPHGSFYNESTQQGFAANCLLKLILHFKLPLMGMPGTLHQTIAEKAGVTFIREGFVDRLYGKDGLLVPRSAPGAVLTSSTEIVRQACHLADRVDSLCLHGDTPNCVEIAKLVRKELEDRGWKISPHA